MTVPSATNINATLCVPNLINVTALGTVLPGSGTVGSGDCSVVFGSSNDAAMLLMSQSDGSGRAMARTPTGTYDNDFAGDGSGLFNNGGDEFAYGATVQPDGKIVVVGERGGDWYAARINPNGTLDTAGFNAPNGWISFPMEGGTEQANEVVVQPDGKLVLVGVTNDKVGVARLTSVGALDTATFGGGTGKMFTSIPGFVQSNANAVDLQADGKIVVVGRAYTPVNDSTLTMRYSAAGVLDTTFSGNGWDVLDFTSGDKAFAVLVTSSGRILVAGGPAIAGPVLVGYDKDGLLDTGWGGTGIVTIPGALFGPGITGGMGQYLAETADGSIIVAADLFDGAGLTSGVARLSTGGVLDVSYAGDGANSISSVNDDRMNGAAVMADGSVVATGTQWFGCCPFVARFAPDGTADVEFDDDGYLQTDSGGAVGGGGGVDVVALPDGEFAVVSQAWNGSNRDVVIEQFGTIQVSDYVTGGGSDRDWSSGNTTDMFGACLRTIAGGALLDGSTWARDVGDGDCLDGDTDPWKPIAATTADLGAKVAKAPSLATTAQVNLAFGFRTRLDQPPGNYTAPVVFTVVAPAT